MANDRADAIGKATQDLAAMHDKESLHTVMADLQHLKGADDKIDKGDQQGIFKQDVAQIAKSVDLKALGLDGFHVASYAESDNHQYLLALKPGANQGDKPDVKIVDQDGVFYKRNGNHLDVDSSQKQAFAATDTQAPAPVPAPVKVADSGDTRGDAAPAAPAAAGADNSFGTHGRTFDVGADGKAVYTTKHGDTYWSVARDLLTKSDKPAPSNAEILAQVNALATLNNKSDANKLATGEHIILPITPAAPEAAPAAPAKPEVQQAPAPASPEAVKPPVEGAKPPVTELQKPTAPAPAEPAAPAAPLGFDMKAHADALKPQNGVYSPLSPLGMNGLGLDADKATLAGDAKAPVTKDNVTTQETDLNLKDGAIFGYWRTGVKNVDTTQGNILKSRETSYDSGVQMKMAGPKGAVELNGVTHVVTTMQDNGMYKTVVTAGDGQHTFSTDSTGKVQRSTDANNQASVLEAPTATDVAALNVQPLPTAVADASVAPAVAAPKAVDSAVDVP